MSKILYQPNLFLELQELQRTWDFLQEKGSEKYKGELINSYGVIPESYHKMGFAYNVTVSATVDSIDIVPGVAINKNFDYLLGSGETMILPQNPTDIYFIRITYSATNLEIGAVEVDSIGSMVGVNTKFTQVLRGQPNFPTKVRFYDPGTKTWLLNEYEVLRVVDDLNVILQGDFTTPIPNGYKYAVVGAFSPDYFPSNDGLIYEYDSVTIDYDTGIDINNPPTLTADLQFYIAACQNIGGAVTVLKDMRPDYKFSLNPLFADEGYHRDARINDFQKYSIYSKSLPIIPAAPFDWGVIRLGVDANNTPEKVYIEVDMTGWGGGTGVIIQGFLKYDGEPFAVGTKLRLIRTDDSQTVRLAKPNSPNGVRQGFVEYSEIFYSFTTGDQVTDPQWKKGEVLEIYCVDNQYDGVDGVMRSYWMTLSNLARDSKVVRDQQEWNNKAVFVNGVNGIIDTASCDAAGARSGSIYIS